MSIATTTLGMYVGEVRTFVWDFSNFPEIAAGDLLTGTPTVPTAAGLTIGTPAVNVLPVRPDATSRVIVAGKCVTAVVTAVTAGTYTLVCTVATTGGSTLSIKGVLIVE